MKKILGLTCSILLLSAGVVQAQVVLERGVIAATGNVGMTFDATVGEVVIQTHTNGASTLTQRLSSKPHYGGQNWASVRVNCK